MTDMSDRVLRSAAKNPRALRGLLPFLRPYRARIALALLFLVGAAAATLVLPVALKSLIDGGLAGGASGAQVMVLRGYFLLLFGVGVAMGVLSALRFYMVSWLGERISADLRNAVYAHVVRQSPEFFETTQTGEVLSRLTTDTTLVQTVVGSSLSLGLRNTVMGLGALVMLVATNPRVMGSVLGILLLVVLGADYVQRGQFAAAPALLGVGIALLVACVLLINGFPDARSDASVGKRTLVVRLGPRRAALLFAALVLLAHAWVALCAFAWLPWPGAAWGLLSLPLAATGAALLWRHARQPQRLRPAIALTIASANLHALALAAGLLTHAPR